MDVLRWHRLDGYKSCITLDKSKCSSMEEGWQSLCVSIRSSSKWTLKIRSKSNKSKVKHFSGVSDLVRS